MKYLVIAFLLISSTYAKDYSHLDWDNYKKHKGNSNYRSEKIYNAYEQHEKIHVHRVTKIISSHGRYDDRYLNCGFYEGNQICVESTRPKRFLKIIKTITAR